LPSGIAAGQPDSGEEVLCVVPLEREPGLFYRNRRLHRISQNKLRPAVVPVLQKEQRLSRAGLYHILARGEFLVLNVKSEWYRDTDERLPISRGENARPTYNDSFYDVAK
jgi:hypothetical protein